MKRLKFYLLSTTAAMPQRRWFQWPREADGSYCLSIDNRPEWKWHEAEGAWVRGGIAHPDSPALRVGKSALGGAR